MALLAATIEQHPKLIAAVLGGVILFFLVACIFNDLIPICHYIFGCDHRFH